MLFTRNKLYSIWLFSTLISYYVFNEGFLLIMWFIPSVLAMLIITILFFFFGNRSLSKPPQYFGPRSYHDFLAEEIDDERVTSYWQIPEKCIVYTFVGIIFVGIIFL